MRESSKWSLLLPRWLRVDPNDERAVAEVAIETGAPSSGALTRARCGRRAVASAAGFVSVGTVVEDDDGAEDDACAADTAGYTSPYEMLLALNRCGADDEDDCRAAGFIVVSVVVARRGDDDDDANDGRRVGTVAAASCALLLPPLPPLLRLLPLSWLFSSSSRSPSSSPKTKFQNEFAREAARPEADLAAGPRPEAGPRLSVLITSGAGDEGAALSTSERARSRGHKLKRGDVATDFAGDDDATDDAAGERGAAPRMGPPARGDEAAEEAPEADDPTWLSSSPAYASSIVAAASCITARLKLSDSPPQKLPLKENCRNAELQSRRNGVVVRGGGVRSPPARVGVWTPLEPSLPSVAVAADPSALPSAELALSDSSTDAYR